MTAAAGAGVGTPAVEVAGLRKAYGARPVLDDVSFAVPRGSLFALLGPNGAGKTTTVEILEGYRRPDGGTVRVLGLEPSRDRAALRARVEAEHGDVAGVALAVALEDLDRRRLAGAVRAEQAEDLAGRDLEVDPAHRLDAVVRLAQADHGDGTRHIW